MKLLKAKYSSPGEKGKRGFEDLDCYTLALDVLVNAHQVAGALPGDEKYDLAQQIRRAGRVFPRISLKVTGASTSWIYYVSIQLRVVH